MVAYASIRAVNRGGKVLERGYVSGVVSFVLGPSAGDEVIEGLHLGGHSLHLGVNDADGFLVDGFGGFLDGSVVLVDSLDRG